MIEVSGSGRPKNTWIRWIRIRNTGKNEEISCLKSSLLESKLLLEPECPLQGFKKTYVKFEKKPWSESGSGFSNSLDHIWIQQKVWTRIRTVFSESGSETLFKSLQV